MLLKCKHYVSVAGNIKGEQIADEYQETILKNNVLFVESISKRSVNEMKNCID